ncbi:MAG: FixH family protein [Cyclobacteriaceae bacterium]
MNWGNRIVLAFVLFAAFILYMVVVAFDQDFDLVANDYYAQELNYQQKMEQKINLANLKDSVLISQEKQSIVLTFPLNQKPNGEIHFYHSSRDQFDQKLEIATNAANRQVVKNEFVPGSYRINITWESNGTEYFQQEKIFIQ